MESSRYENDDVDFSQHEMGQRRVCYSRFASPLPSELTEEK